MRFNNMATLSLEEITELLRQEFGPTLAGGRDEGLDKMADAVEARGVSPDESEAALAELVEEGAIRYISEPVGGVGAGVLGVLDAPTGADFGMTDGRPGHGAVAASQEHGTGYWLLSDE
jgi:hypothetical protein